VVNIFHQFLNVGAFVGALVPPTENSEGMQECWALGGS
jgi:hypothetical protein